jgi:hypothetical protein
MTSDNDSILRKKFLGCMYGSQNRIARFGPRCPEALRRLTIRTKVYIDKGDFEIHFPVEARFAAAEGDYCGIMGVVTGYEACNVCRWCTFGNQYGTKNLGQGMVYLDRPITVHISASST